MAVRVERVVLPAVHMAPGHYQEAPAAAVLGSAASHDARAAGPIQLPIPVQEPQPIHS